MDFEISKADVCVSELHPRRKVSICICVFPVKVPKQCELSYKARDELKKHLSFARRSRDPSTWMRSDSQQRLVSGLFFMFTVRQVVLCPFLWGEERSRCWYSGPRGQGKVSIQECSSCHALEIPWWKTSYLPCCGHPFHCVHRAKCKDTKSIVEKGSIEVRFSSVPCLPCLLHLSFSTSYQSYFWLWGLCRKITYCTESRC